MTKVAQFNDEERRKIADALGRWAKNHPAPHEPMVFTARSGIVFSAQMMADAVIRPGSREADEVFHWLGMIVGAGDEMTLDQLLESFEMLANLEPDDAGADAKKEHKRRPPEPRP